jgi:quercetin dioxygenase-like cupin family protein
MKIQHYTQTRPEPVAEGPGITVRWVVGKEDGAPHFAMRVFEVEPGHSTPYHSHAWEHEVFVLTGEGTVRHEVEQETAVSHGSVVFVPGMEPHQFINRGDGILRFICLVPIEG